MKTLKLRLIPERKSPGSTFGAHYGATCPFCSDKLTIWPSEFKAQRDLRTDTGNVCLHFDGFTKSGTAIMRPKMSVVAAGNVVRVNGVKTKWSLVGLLNQLESLDEEASTHDWISWPSWCPKRRFVAIKTEAWRVHNANPKRWEAQNVARKEENERAELARLKAKYEV